MKKFTHSFFAAETKTAAEAIVFSKGVAYDTQQDIIEFVSVVDKQVDVYGTGPVELSKNGKQILGSISFNHKLSEDEVSQIQEIYDKFLGNYRYGSPKIEFRLTVKGKWSNSDPKIS